MAAAKAQTLADWLKDLEGGKFKEPIGAKRSLGYKKTWKKEQISQAIAAIDKKFQGRDKEPAIKKVAPLSPVPTKRTEGWTDYAVATINLCERVINSQGRALELMDKGLIPQDIQASEVFAENIIRCGYLLNFVLPAGVHVVEEAKAPSPPPAREPEEEEQDDDEGPNKFRA